MTPTARPPRTSRMHGRSPRELAIPLHRVSFAARVPRAGFRALPRRTRRRTHAQPGRAVQPRDQVRRLPRAGRSAWAATHFATGHYARLRARRPTARAATRRAMPPRTRAISCTPWHASTSRACSCRSGSCTKSEVRERARAAGLPVFDKPDSTGICFIGERPFREFLRGSCRAHRARSSPRTASSWAATRDWRSTPWASATGLHIGGRHGRAEEPWYVAAKDAARNALVVVQGHDHPLLSSTSLTSGPWHWLTPPRAARLQRPGQSALPAGGPGSAAAASRCGHVPRSFSNTRSAR